MATNKATELMDWLSRARPLVHQTAHEIQPFGHLVKLPISRFLESLSVPVAVHRESERVADGPHG